MAFFFILQSKLSSVSLLVPFHNQRITKWTSKINRFCSALEANYQMNFKYTIIIINFKQILKGNQRYFTISQPSQMNVDSLTQIQDMLQNWNFVKSCMRIKICLHYYMDGFDVTSSKTYNKFCLMTMGQLNEIISFSWIIHALFQLAFSHFREENLINRVNAYACIYSFNSMFSLNDLFYISKS